MAGAALKPSNATTSGARLTASEERVARSIVAAHRARLEWLLRVPEWEDLLAAGMVELGLPGRRQGIAFRAAVSSCPLESKHQLVRWAIQRFRRHLPSATGRRMCRLLGIEAFSELELDELLTARQWQETAARALFRLSREHQRYKHAQQMLFVGYSHLVDQVVAQMVFDAGHRADCRQEGCLGLLQAIDRVDATNGDFGAFSLCWIRRQVRNYLMRQRLPVYAPVNLISRASRRSASGPRSAPGNPPPVRRIEMLLLECLRHPAVSLDEPLADGAGSVVETVPDSGSGSPAESVARADVRSLVGRMVESLTEKQREVLVRRFGLGGGAVWSVTEIARAVGISHQQVSMREKRALQRLEAVLVPLVTELHGGL